MPKLLGVVLAVAVVLVLAVTYLWATRDAAAEIARVRAQVEYLTAEREEVKSLASRNDSIQRELADTRVALQAQIDRNDMVVDSLDRVITDQRLTVFRLRRPEDIAAKFSQTFPELTHASNWGVHEIYDEEAELGILYLSVPLAFATSSMIEHETLTTLQTQVDTLKQSVQLGRQALTVSDSMFTLEHATRVAFEEKYDTLFVSYEGLSGDYIKELQKPAFRFDFVSIGLLVGALAAGVAIAK